MGQPSQEQKAQDLHNQILQEKYRRVNQEVKAILDREGVAFQAYLHYTEGGIVPMVRLVERKAKSESHANGKAEESV